MRDARLEHERSPITVNYSNTSIDSSEPEEASVNPDMLEKCRYCGCADAKSLKQCLFCGSVAYCSDEHQQFDWKRHKPVCKQTQTEMQRRLAAASAGPSSCTTHTQTERICSTSTPSPDSSPPCSESSATFVAGMGPSSLVGRLTLESQFALHGLSGASPVTCVREGSPKAPVIFDVASLTSGYHFI
ncbi:hypothetical protein Y032_0030g2018 [Ancylostoma ceylanicum]|uniref:MYND-type domain-containing protein n=1 Tax=Ancylostoma ceylanicum TaxID=53326 RepID=A0A016UQB1_9BILA|nr:hypothetical protein Y032_0030g2018 [Ancylostoma ceylanicum]